MLFPTTQTRNNVADWAVVDVGLSDRLSHRRNDHISSFEGGLKIAGD